jgi:TRAP-type C4-dicarboxylate transport system permease small subunit
MEGVREGIPAMGWLAPLKRFIQKLNFYVAGIGAFFLIPLMLLTAADVFSRDVLNHPIPGTVELSEYLLAVFILLGIAYTQQVKGYVGVSLFLSKLPPWAQSVCEIITTLLSIAIFCVLAWQGWKVGIAERTVSDMLRVPQYPFRLLVAVAAFLMCFELLIDLVNAMNKLFRRS